MQNPRRTRTIALAIVASGIVVACVHANLAAPRAEDPWFVVPLVLYWPNAILFGAGYAWIAHRRTAAQRKLAGGDDLLSRWTIDAVAWSAFLAHEHALD